LCFWFGHTVSEAYRGTLIYYFFKHFYFFVKCGYQRPANETIFEIELEIDFIIGKKGSFFKKEEIRN
jgi:hypothetical protein